MKKTLLFCALVHLTLFANAKPEVCVKISPLFNIVEEDDATKTLLKHSSVCIHKAQKTMLAFNKSDVSGKMAQAVRLQTFAVKLYTAKKEKEAACASLEARRIASEIIKEITGKEDAYASVSNEEAALAGTCGSREAQLKNSLKTVTNISDKDSDYTNPAFLNNTNIDLN